jgi:hypothetical protein
MDTVLRSLLTDRLRAATDLGAEAAQLVLDACDGPEAAGEPAAAPQPVWLRSVTVEGFRGIGPAATLTLEPRPGLTVVVGRNGSGKSSFAEGLELLMTGALKRWEKRPKAWTETWQCLHHAERTRLAAELALGGSGDLVTLEQSWARGAAYDDAAGRGPAAAALAAHGWDRGLGSFRPFLSYAELATMFDTLTSLYDALSPVLGLADVDDVARRLGETRLELDNRRKAAGALRDTLLARLGADPDDARAALVSAAVGARKPDFDAIAELLRDTPAYAPDATGTPLLRRLAGLAAPTDTEVDAAFEALADARAARAEVASTDAKRAVAIAVLLRQALAVRDERRLTDDCPVCDTPDVLDAAWAAEAKTQAARLDAQAQALTRADAAVAAATRRIEGLIDAEAPALARQAGLVAADLPAARDAKGAKAAAAELRGFAARAQAELAGRDLAWQQVVAQVAQWLGQAREVGAAAVTLKALKEAEKWVKGAAEELRDERFAPISERAIANWRELRQGSSVDLHEITLKKAGRGGRADFDVRADGEAANALGVMSQGELLALSVSVFLPRAALDESPFRFAVIDDPVQAMDPSKVDGLARVLHGAAATRQIVVFTHDDRLPEAIRRLKLDATLLHVDRRARSSVDVRVSRTPVRRYLDGARRFAIGERLPADVQARVVPMFCRSAVEAAAADIVRLRAARSGASVELADEQLREARSLRETLALALFGEAGRGGDVAGALKASYGVETAALVAALNTGAHGKLDAGTVARLPERTRDFIAALMSAA